MARQPDLHVFVHIPKTAGITFSQNIESAIQPAHSVRTGFTHHEPYFDMNAQKYKFYEGKESFEKYIGSLNPSQISLIRYLGGHDSYYGIHELFKRPARYMTFVREPIARTISLYNFERGMYELFSRKQNLDTLEATILKRVKDNFLVDGRVPSFEEWLETTYDKKHPFYYSMTRYLQYLKFLGNKVTSQAFSEAFAKFDFIGITERYDEDALFLYHQLSVKQVFSDLNVSSKYVSAAKMDKSTLEKIESLNSDDLMLYEAALKHNDLFRQQTKTFYAIVKWERAKTAFRDFYRPVWSPIKQILRPLYKKIFL